MRDPGPGDGHRDATIARGGRFALAHNPETLVGSERAFGLALRALDGVETPSLVMMTAPCPMTAVLRQGLLYRPDGCACPRHAAPLMAALKLNVPTK